MTLHSSEMDLGLSHNCLPFISVSSFSLPVSYAQASQITFKIINPSLPLLLPLSILAFSIISSIISLLVLSLRPNHLILSALINATTFSWPSNSSISLLDLLFNSQSISTGPQTLLIIFLSSILRCCSSVDSIVSDSAPYVTISRIRVCPGLVSGHFWQFWITEHQVILYMYDLRSIFYYEYIHHYTRFYY